MDGRAEQDQARSKRRPLKVCTSYWHGQSSYTYCDDDVIQLHNQLERHAGDFELVVYADQAYDIPGRIERLDHPPNYHSLVECYREAGPMMVIGLDTVIRGDIDDLPFDKLRATKPARHPRVNVGVVLVPEAPNTVYQDFKWSGSDMPHLRKYVEDLLPPTTAASYKFDDWHDAKIVYFHGTPKPRDVNWLQ